MGFSFNDDDIKRISEVLGQEPDSQENSWVWSLRNDEQDKPMIVSLYNCICFDDEVEGSLISVQTRHGYYELHSLTGFLVFEPDEIIFVCSKETNVSSLIIGKGNTCSLFANIHKDLLKRDFSEIDPAALLSAMQVSIVESIL